MAGEIKTGTYEGTGAAINIELGFVPDYIRILNVEDGDAGWTWFKGMANGTAVGEGTALSSVASNGVSEYAGTLSTRKGFTVGTAISESGKTFRYVAMRNGEY